MAIKYGLIAEDNSDIEVIKRLARKLLGKSISEDRFVGKGCSRIKKKVLGWCNALEIKGCTQILLLHDLDRANASELRAALETALGLAPQKKKVVVIPTEELEAWLLSDHEAIQKALKLRKPIKEEHEPERIRSPKEHLSKSVWKMQKVQYVNAVHNPLIADFVDISRIKSKCPSFKPFETFFTSN